MRGPVATEAAFPPAHRISSECAGYRVFGVRDLSRFRIPFVVRDLSRLISSTKGIGKIAWGKAVSAATPRKPPSSRGIRFPHFALKIFQSPRSCLVFELPRKDFLNTIAARYFAATVKAAEIFANLTLLQNPTLRPSFAKGVAWRAEISIMFHQ